MNRTLCPECEYSLKLGARAHKGQKIVCPECQSKLAIVSVDPFEVELITPDHSAATVVKTKTIDIDCPECEGFVRLSVKVPEGYQLVCPTCKNALEVISTDPIELEMAIPTKLKQRHAKSREPERRKPVNGKKIVKPKRREQV